MIPKVNADFIRERGRLHFAEWIQEESDVAVFYSLWTDCGRYCLARVDSTMGTGSDWACCWQDAGLRKLISRDHRSIGRALVALMAFHRNRYGLEHEAQVNEDEIEIAAKNFLPAPAKVGYDGGKPTPKKNEIAAPLEQWAAAGRAGYQMIDDFKFNAKENSMQVQEKVITALFAKVGLEKTPPEKWVKRLSNLGQYVAEDAELTASEKKLVASLEEAVKAGAKIEVVAGKSNGKAGAKPKKKTEVKAKPVAGEGTDKFGSRIGSIAAKINAVLTKSPQTMADILKKSGVEKQQYGHLRDLAKRKLIVASEEGYALAK